jgi:acyl-CoA thioesterase
MAVGEERAGSAFERDTSVRPLGDGAYEGSLAGRWWIGRAPNGGYLAAVMLRALEAALSDPGRAPRSVTVHYLTPPKEGPVTVSCGVERAGRALSTLSARMHQDDRLIALALAAFSEPWPAGIELDDAAPPDVPPPEALEPPSWERPRFAENFDTRFTFGTTPFSGPAEALTGGWIRLNEPQVADDVYVMMLADAWPPAVFQLAEGFFPVPTVELTVHFRAALPLAGATAEDFHLVRFRTMLIRDGFLEEDGAIWSRDGQLLAQSRQLALALPAPGPADSAEQPG